MEIALCGFHRAGKTSVFKLLSQISIPPSEQHKQHVANVKLPDSRLDELAQIFKPPKVTPVEFTFVDFPGADGSKFFKPEIVAKLRTADGLLLVLGAFPEYSKAIEPIRELEALTEEMILIDLTTVENRIARLKKEGRKDKEMELFERMKETLESNKRLSELKPSLDELKLLSSYALLTLKPFFCAVNVGEDGLKSQASWEIELSKRGIIWGKVSAKIELELMEISESERELFLQDLGVNEPASARILRNVIRALNLITFYTVNEKELRAWAIAEGTTAYAAAGKIHTDIQKGFIRAEVAHYDDVISAGGLKNLKDRGKIRLEGKDYIVCDGDLIYFRFNPPQ